MNKFLAILACIVMLLSTVGCKKDKKKEKHEASAKDSSAVDSKIDISDSSEVNSGEKAQADDTARKFYTTLKDKDYDTLSKLISVSDKKVFNLLSDVELKDFELTYIEHTGFYTYSYRLSFNAECKNNNLFINGKNMFLLDIESSDTGAYKVTNFNPENAFYQYTYSGENPCDYSHGVSIGYEYLQNQLPLIKNSDYVLTPPCSRNNFDYLTMRAICLYCCYNGQSSYVRPSEVNDFISQTFNFNSLNLEKSTYYNKNSGFFESWQTEYPSAYFTKNKSFTQLSNSEFEIVINYYADSASFFNAKTVKYVITRTADDLYIVKSRTVVFDSGFPVLNIINGMPNQ